MEIKNFKELNETETYNIILSSYNLDYNILMSVNIHEPLETRAYYKGIITGIIRYGIDPIMYDNAFIGNVLLDVQMSSMVKSWKEVPISIKKAIKHNVEEYAERRKEGEAFSSEIAVLDLYDKLIS